MALALLSLGVVLLSATTVHGYSCTYSFGGVNYDASPLAASTDYTFTDNQGNTFWLNLCQPVVVSTCGGTSAACQQWDPKSANGHASLGSATTATFVPPKIPGENGQGFTVQFTDGDVPPGGTAARNMEIDFSCDSGAGAGVPSYQGEQPQLHYNFQWRSKYACQAPAGSWTTGSGSTGSTGTTGGSKTEGGISGGSVFLITVSCSAVAYIGAGIAWNHFKMHNTGLELIPNVGFWTSIPGLVKDGALFIWAKITRKDGYSSV